MSHSSRNLYDILGVERDASHHEIKSRYRKLLLQVCISMVKLWYRPLYFALKPLNLNDIEIFDKKLLFALY